jgi:hypothetical protein
MRPPAKARLHTICSMVGWAGIAGLVLNVSEWFLLLVVPYALAVWRSFRSNRCPNCGANVWHVGGGIYGPWIGSQCRTCHTDLGEAKWDQ